MTEYDRRAMAEDRMASDPDGSYWQYLFSGARNDLVKLIGKDGYEQWAELVWPGETIDGQTWKQIYKRANRAADEANKGERDVAKLAHVATYEWETIPQCYGL
jgi:hypothetical protein